MEKTNKFRILSWILIVLLATNLSMAVSFMWFRHNQKVSIRNIDGIKSEMPAEQRTRFFREQLNLDFNQLDTFRTLNRNFNFNAHGITMQLERLRIEMVTELGNENPDISKLDSLTIKIGSLHTGLKNLTVDYYLGMKNVCSKKQKEKLNAIFMSALRATDEIAIPRQGQQYGRKNK